MLFDLSPDKSSQLHGETGILLAGNVNKKAKVPHDAHDITRDFPFVNFHKGKETLFHDCLVRAVADLDDIKTSFERNLFRLVVCFLLNGHFTGKRKYHV